MNIPMLQRVVFPVVLSVVVTMLFAASMLILANGNISKTIFVGRNFGATKYWKDMFLYNDGYDGQFFFYIAHDPFNVSYLQKILDVPAHRYKRIVYPLLSWSLSGGRHEYIPWALLAINILLMPVIVLLINVLLIKLKVTWLPYYYVSLCISSYLFTLKYNLSEILASTFLLSALLMYTSNRLKISGMLFLLAALTKEIYCIVPISLFIYNYIFYRTALLQILFQTIGGLLIWNLAIYSFFKAPMQEIPNMMSVHFGNPLSNVHTRISHDMTTIASGNLEISSILTLVFVLFVVVVGYTSLVELLFYKNRSFYNLFVIIAVCVVCLYGSNIWIDGGPESYIRVSEILVISSILNFSVSDRWRKVLVFYPLLFGLVLYYIFSQNDIGLLYYR